MKSFLSLRLVVVENPHHLLINVRRRSLNLTFLSSTMDRSAAMNVLLRVFRIRKFSQITVTYISILLVVGFLCKLTGPQG